MSGSVDSMLYSFATGSTIKPLPTHLVYNFTIFINIYNRPNIHTKYSIDGGENRRSACHA